MLFQTVSPASEEGVAEHPTSNKSTWPSNISTENSTVGSTHNVVPSTPAPSLGLIDTVNPTDTSYPQSPGSFGLSGTPSPFVSIRVGVLPSSRKSSMSISCSNGSGENKSDVRDAVKSTTSNLSTTVPSFPS